MSSVASAFVNLGQEEAEISLHHVQDSQNNLTQILLQSSEHGLQIYFHIRSITCKPDSAVCTHGVLHMPKIQEQETTNKSCVEKNHTEELKTMKDDNLT